MEKFNFGGFIRECYLRSTPSVDINDVTSENPIRCSDHRLSVDDYNAICVDYGLTDKDGNTLDHDRLCGCNMWILMSGPQLYEPKTA